MSTARDSSAGIAARYGLDGPGDRIPVGARFSAPVQTGPGTHPAFCTVGTGSFKKERRLGHGAEHPPLPKRRGHEMLGLYLYSPSWAFVAGYRENLYLYIYIQGVSRL